MTLSPGTYRMLADAVVVFHLGFILFVVLGGLVVLRWRRAALVHLPCAAWGALIEFGDWICPLTPLENHLRALGRQPGYAGGFVEHYIIPAMYPDFRTRTVEIAIGIFVITINLLFYWLAFGGRSGSVDPVSTRASR